MTDYCVAFLHHDSGPVTAANLAAVRAANPDAAVVPIHRRDGHPCDPLPGSVEVTTAPAWAASNWHDADLVWVAWYAAGGAPAAERYVLLESDCYCNVPLADVYPPDGDAWAASPGGVWPAVKPQPLNGVCLSRAVMDRLAARPNPIRAHCSDRLGMALRFVGARLAALPEPHVSRNVVARLGERRPDAAGMWHPVRSLVDPAAVPVRRYVPPDPPAVEPPGPSPAQPTPPPVAPADAVVRSAERVASRTAACRACPHLRHGDLCGVLVDRGRGAWIMGGRGIPLPAARCPDDPSRWGAVVDG